MEKNESPMRTVAELLGGGLARYRVTKITRILKSGEKEVKKVNFEVDNIEAFRKKMKGRKFVDVQLVYEEI